MKHLLICFLFLSACGEDYVQQGLVEVNPPIPEFNKEDCRWVNWYDENGEDLPTVIDTSYDTDISTPGIQMVVGAEFHNGFPEDIRLVFLGNGHLYHTERVGNTYWGTISIKEGTPVYLLETYSYGFCEKASWIFTIEW